MDPDLIQLCLRDGSPIGFRLHELLVLLLQVFGLNLSTFLAPLPAAHPQEGLKMGHAVSDGELVRCILSLGLVDPTLVRLTLLETAFGASMSNACSQVVAPSLSERRGVPGDCPRCRSLLAGCRNYCLYLPLKDQPSFLERCYLVFRHQRISTSVAILILSLEEQTSLLNSSARRLCAWRASPSFLFLKFKLERGKQG